ncbi:hypothetical protein [Janthinobacterium sp. AD80]|uniref:hypothetical protein n=1 Tax=Janthinobacterium sp. AD80 TaxID=1528773 RepID=UPI0011AEEC24|nr:hypothetical protein [Janthinobacterium sp. AD80]
MKMKNIANLVLLSATLISTTANAAFCDENIVTLISHSNGNVYFTTDKTCQYWCQISGNPAFIKQTYAMMMTAQLTNKKLAFAWNELTACNEINKVYAVPDFAVAAP